jgi:gas vesicle protein
MAKKEDGDASFLLGLVLGIFIGAGVALALSPGSGEENRTKLSQGVKDATSQLQGKAEEAMDSVEKGVDEAKQNVEKAVNEATQ